MTIYKRYGGAFLCVVLYLLLGKSIAVCAKESAGDPVSMAKHVEFLSSVEGVRSLNNAKESSLWESTKGKTHFGFRQRNHWFRVDLTNHLQNDKQYIIEFGFIFLDKIEAFFVVDGELIKRALSGDNVAYSKRDVDNRKILFEVPPADGKNITLYFKTYAQGMTQIPMDLWLERDFENFDANNRVWNGFYFGAMSIMLFYHLFLYSVIKRTDILVYMLLLAGVLGFRFVAWGYGHQYLWPSGAELTNRIPPSINCLNMVASLIFCYTFLSIERYGGFLKKYFQVLIGCSVLVFLMSIILPLPFAVIIAIFYGTLINVSITAAAVYLMSKGVRVAKFYGLALVPVIIAVILMMLSFIGVIDVSTLSKNGGSVGLLLMICLLAIAIGDNIRIEQKQAQERILALNEDLESKVVDRTKDLEESLGVLKNTQKDLVEAEKMSALTGLVAGVAHEINTPLGIGVTAASSLKEELGTFSGKVSHDDLSRSDLARYLSRTEEALGLIENSLDRASQQVKSFKLLIVDLPDGKTHPFNVHQHINDSLLLMAAQLEKHGHDVEVNCSDTLTVSTFASLITQVLMNLILNSIQHAFRPGQRGRINIDAQLIGSHLVLDYKDDGQGLSEEELHNLFNPFYTSKRGSGHVGLGTTVTYNIVTHGLKGDIRPVSRPGEGLSYHIRVPVDTRNS